MRNRLGKPGVATPRWARAPSAHCWCRSAPPTPVISIGARNWVAAKPVPQMITSASNSRPSAVRTPDGSIVLILSVTTSTWSRASAGYQSLEKRIRLQPIS